MTEKRFEEQNLENHLNRIYDTKKGRVVFDEDIVDLLNELNDECEFLEIENEALEDGATRYAELCHKSLKENEQLKKENEQLKKENEELKQELLETIDDLSDNRPNKKGFAGSGRFA